MKTKRSILALSKAFFILLLSSCLVSCIEVKSDINEDSDRMQVKESKIIGGYKYSIVEIDSVEYLAGRGGIIRISK